MLTVFGWRDWIQCIANCCDAAVYSQNVYYYLAKSFPWVWLIHCTSGKMQIYMIILYEQLCLNVLNIVPHTNNWFRLWWGENSGKWKICAAFVGNWTLSCQLKYNNWAPTSPHNPNIPVVFPAATQHVTRKLADKKLSSGEKPCWVATHIVFLHLNTRNSLPHLILEMRKFTYEAKIEERERSPVLLHHSKS